MGPLVFLRKLLSVFLSIIGLLRRGLNKVICRAKRLRRDSGTVLPLTNDQITNTEVPQSVPSNDIEFESWDSWDGGMSNNQKYHKVDKVAEYRYKQQMELKAQPQPEADYFQDMLPDFRKAKKLLVKQREEQQQHINHTNHGYSNRLAMGATMIPQEDGLGSWEDTEGAWENEAAEDLSWEAEAAIREKRQLERQKRQMENQRKKMEKEAQRAMKKDGMTAVKLS